MKKYLTQISLVLILLPSAIYSQWYLQYQSPTFAGFYDVRFLIEIPVGPVETE